MRGHKRKHVSRYRPGILDWFTKEPNLDIEMAKQAKDYIDSWGQTPDNWGQTPDSWGYHTVISTTNTSIGMMPTHPAVFPNVKEQLDIKKPEDIGQVVDKVNKLLMSLLPKTIIYTIQKMDGKDQIMINFDLSVLKSDDEKERVILFDDEE